MRVTAGSPSDDPPPLDPEKDPSHLAEDHRPYIPNPARQWHRRSQLAAHARPPEPLRRRPSLRAPPTGAPGMRGFPRARITAGDRDSRGSRSTAVSVTLALREQAEAEAAATVSASTPSTATSPGRRRARKPGPARPAVVGRPTTPDESPLAHAPAASRPGEPPLRTTVGREKTPVSLALAPLAPLAPAASHAPRTRRRIEPTSIGATSSRTGDPTARPRPSRVLAELHAALADEAAAAE